MSLEKPAGLPQAAGIAKQVVWVISNTRAWETIPFTHEMRAEKVFVVLPFGTGKVLSGMHQSFAVHSVVLDPKNDCITLFNKNSESQAQSQIY